MSAATREKLWEIWQLVLEAHLSYLTETPPNQVRANRLAEAAAFLKDNGISVDVMELRDVRRSLAELRGLSLPFTPTKKDDTK